MLGLLPSDLDNGAVEIWPENQRAVEAFLSMGTQWRVGNAGPIGLDYNALTSVLRLLRTPRSEWQDIFWCVRILEDEALTAMREGVK